MDGQVPKECFYNKIQSKKFYTGNMVIYLGRVNIKFARTPVIRIQKYSLFSHIKTISAATGGLF